MATFTVSTKPSKLAAAISTALTVVDNATREQLVAMATSYAVIKRQNHWRKHGIPASDSINLADLAPGKRQVVAAMTPADIAAKAAVDADFRKSVLDAMGYVAEEEVVA